jgi:hypothetical protein
VVGDIQALESTLSVFFALQKIDWRHPTISVEFEDSDARDADWGSLDGFRVRPKTWPPLHATERHFVQISYLAFSAHSLAILESFWREGEYHMAEGSYTIAFFNFYFVLEGLYGKGKTKNKQIEKEFLASADLKAFIHEHMHSPTTDRLVKQVFDLLPSDNKQSIPDEAALISLLVSVRGRLHHFSNNPNRPHGSPLNQHEYEGIATFARFLANKSLVAQLAKLTPDAFRHV